MKRFILLVVSIVSCQQQPISVKKKELNLIPKPQSIIFHDDLFEINEQTTFILPDSLLGAAHLLIEKFKIVENWNLNTQKEQKNTNFIEFSIDKTLEKDAYTLHSTQKNIKITSSTYKGCVNAVQTIRQLLPTEIETTHKITKKVRWTVPSVTITDKPAYKWRGLMLDVSRHFFSKEYILKTIDRMALLKLNVFHFHLVDNEGWRVEIKKYPKLTEIGAWRDDLEHLNWNDRQNKAEKQAAKAQNKRYGGYYTQEDIREIVQYAAKRGIEVIPEIEMPAHTMSSIASYPFLSCHKRPIDVPSGGVWPITDIYCAGQEETFTFLENVLAEVITLFPSPYIHIGGDEATHTEWEKCRACNKRMAENNLKNAHQLQSYFIKRIENYLIKHNKTLIGWDEVIEGGLPSTAMIMNWRGIDIGRQAIEKGHQLVLTSDFYINKYQGNPENEPLAINGYLSLKDIYTHELNKKDIPEDKKQFVLGAQANLWSEYVTNDKTSEYMLFPRLLAFSEIVWNDTKKDWKDFTNRVEVFSERLKVMKINASKSVYQVESKMNYQNDEKPSVNISLETQMPDTDIRYLLGEGAMQNAKRYEQPLEIKNTEKLRAATFMNDTILSPIYETEIIFHKAVGKKVVFEPLYHQNYAGQGVETLTNVVRGTKNFQDKQWLAWLDQDATIMIDLEAMEQVKKVVIGALEDQGSLIVFPSEFKIETSPDGKHYKEQKKLTRTPKKDGFVKLEAFPIELNPHQARYIRVSLKNPKKIDNNTGIWIFIDEIQVF